MVTVLTSSQLVNFDHKMLVFLLVLRHSSGRRYPHHCDQLPFPTTRMRAGESTKNFHLLHDNLLACCDHWNALMLGVNQWHYFLLRAFVSSLVLNPFQPNKVPISEKILCTFIGSFHIINIICWMRCQLDRRIHMKRL